MNRLKLLREERNLLQSDIANFLGISIPAYSFYETEKRDMSTEIQKKLANYFDVTIDYLVGNSDIRNPKQENDINEELLKVGFDMKNYNPPTDKQKEQIKALLEVILKDNKKEDNKD